VCKTKPRLADLKKQFKRYALLRTGAAHVFFSDFSTEFGFVPSVHLPKAGHFDKLLCWWGESLVNAVSIGHRCLKITFMSLLFAALFELMKNRNK